MTESRHLRVESNDGSPAKEYRIVGGSVEVRTLVPQGDSDRSLERVWWRLRPEHLSAHVERNTVVAQWLEGRMGWRRLLRACVGEDWQTNGLAGRKSSSSHSHAEAMGTNTLT